jgi:uncharacterized protein (TIGR03083 family)
MSQPSPGADPSTMVATLRAVVTERLGLVAEVSRATPDPARPVPATPAWTVEGVVAHLITSVDRYAAGPTGQMARVSDPAELPALNERLLRAAEGPPLTHLLAELRARTDALLDQVDGYGDAQPSYLFNGDRTVRADQALGILVGELVVHGGDIAAVADRPWPVSARDAELVLYGLEPVLPGFVHPERGGSHSARYDIRMRGGRRYAWEFRNGELDCDADPGGRFDCHISAEPSALLGVMYRRRTPGRVALTGRVTAWGRRPWLGLALAERFHPP